jgi:hypothetical protein
VPCPICATNRWEVVLLPPATPRRTALDVAHCPAFIRCQQCGKEGPMVKANAPQVIEHACAVWNAMAERASGPAA